MLGITALLFVYLLVLGKLYDRAQGDIQFRRRLLGASLTLFALWQLGYQVFEWTNEAPWQLWYQVFQRRNTVTLLRRVDPVYPPLAKQARIQGKVRFDAVINSSGQVEKLTLISGHPLLISAARDAIFQWQYSRPVCSVHTVIEVNFVLKPAL